MLQLKGLHGVNIFILTVIREHVLKNECGFNLRMYTSFLKHKMHLA